MYMMQARPSDLLPVAAQMSQQVYCWNQGQTKVMPFMT